MAKTRALIGAQTADVRYGSLADAPRRGRQLPHRKLGGNEQSPATLAQCRKGLPPGGPLDGGLGLAAHTRSGPSYERRALSALTADCLQRLPRCPLLLDAVEPRLHIIERAAQPRAKLHL